MKTKKIHTGYKNSNSDYIEYKNGRVRVRVGDCGIDFIVLTIPSYGKGVIYKDSKFYFMEARTASNVEMPGLMLIGKDNDGCYVYANSTQEIRPSFLIGDVQEIAEDAMMEILLR